MGAQCCNPAVDTASEAAFQVTPGQSVPDIEDLLRATCAGLGPKPSDVKPGQKYAWCKCGLSKNQPFCDGSHASDPRGKGFQPLIFDVTEPKTAYLCTCKATKNPPYCDGSHAALNADSVGKLLPASGNTAKTDPDDQPRATVGGLGPRPCDVKPGQKYAWCKCGLSKNQPFCDGSHAGDSRGKGFSPLIFEVKEPKTAYLCTCKATKNPPYCDGSHTSLSEDSVGKLLPKGDAAFKKWTIVRTTQISHDTKRIELRCEEKEPLNTKVSSHYTLRTKGVDGETKFRPYTPVRYDDAKYEIDLVIKRYADGQVTPIVHDLKAGDVVDLKGPTPGEYSLQKDAANHTELALFAAGTGITPILQIATALLSSSCRMRVYCSNKSDADVLCQSELDELAKKTDNVTAVHHILSKTNGSTGAFAGRLSAEILGKTLPQPGPGSHAVLCGPPGYVSATKALLRDHGYTEKQITVM